MAYFTEYPYVTERMDPSYDLFIAKIKEVIKITDQLFVTQIHPEYGVYPEGYAQWYEKHQEYRVQPFSVTRYVGESAEEIPFHVFYEKTVGMLVTLLKEADKAIESINDPVLDKIWWSTYMRVLQNAFLHDTWEETEIFYLSMPKGSPISLCLGPIDTYHDKITGTKHFFSGWFLVRNTAQKEIDVLLKHIKELDENVSPEVAFFIGDLLFSGGEVTKHNTMGWSRPGNAQLFENYGAIKTIAINRLPHHNKRMAEAINTSLKTWNISKELSSEIITFHNKHSLLPLVLHEYSHTVNKNPKAHDNLGAFYTDIEETRANTIMVSLAQDLIRKNQLPEHTAKYIFLRVLLYLPYLYEEYTVRQQRESYYYAGLYWMQKAEEHKIITVNEKHITVNESLLEKNLPKLVDELVLSLESISEHVVSVEELTKQKDTFFAYGELMAKGFNW